MRIVRRDARLFLAATSALLADGFGVRFRAGGGSMQPAIGNGDALTLEPVGAAAVRPGDVLLYRKDQRSIAHRVVDIRTRGGAISSYLLKGDAASSCDAPVAPHEVLGRLVALERRGSRPWRTRVSERLRRAIRRWISCPLA